MSPINPHLRVDRSLALWRRHPDAGVLPAGYHVNDFTSPFLKTPSTKAMSNVVSVSLGLQTKDSEVRLRDTDNSGLSVS